MLAVLGAPSAVNAPPSSATVGMPKASPTNTSSGRAPVQPLERGRLPPPLTLVFRGRPVGAADCVSAMGEGRSHRGGADHPETAAPQPEARVSLALVTCASVGNC